MVKKPSYIPQVGEKIFNLTVIDNSEQYLNYTSGRIRGILCKCVCGKQKLIALSKLVSTKSKKLAKSCGCNSYYPGQPRNASRNNPDSPYWELCRAYRAGAKRRNLSFILSTEKCKELMKGNCYYCGVAPELRTRNGIEFYANGIDRIDSSIGYNEENCVSSCRMCNNMKWEMTQEFFLNHIEKLVMYNNLLCKEN